METLKPKFVDAIPEKLDKGVLYISMNRCLAMHLCICGCGNEVVTPFSPTDWELRYYGSSVSLYPSVGNWEFPCRSHYWIRNNRILQAGTMSNQQIRAGRQHDKKNKADYYKDLSEAGRIEQTSEKKKSWYSKLIEIIQNLFLSN